MINCSRCGHVNPLGTLFCHGCGQKLDFSVEDIMGSVASNQTELRKNRVLRAGRSALTLGLFLLLAIGVLCLTMKPDLPPGDVPGVKPRGVDVLLPRDAVGWGEQAAVVDGPQTTATITWPAAMADDDDSLLAWRRTQGTRQLSALGLHLDGIRGWQKRLAATQGEHGDFPGADRLAATGLALLALQAWPGEHEVDASARRAVVWLEKQLPVIKRGGASHLATTLVTWALLEAKGSEDAELRNLIGALASGRSPQWQTLALQRLPPPVRPTGTAALEEALGGSAVWQANLDVLRGSHERRANFAALAEPGTPTTLDALDRFAWANRQWLHLDGLELLGERLQAWSREVEPYPSPAELSAETGPQTDFALAILACTVPCHLPVNRVASR